MTRTVWDVLGIAATQDVAAIRSAYARTLKAIDVDAEPQRYIELRNARDQAVYDARTAAAAPLAAAPERDEAAFADGAPAAIPQASFEEHRAALAGLLMPDGDHAASAVDDGLLRAHFDALLRDPRMADIAFAARAEMQLSELIAMTLPRSLALAGPAVRAFGWHGAVNVDTPPAIVAIRDAADANREDQRFAEAPGAEPSDSGMDPDVAFRAAEYAELVALLVPQDEDPPVLTGDQEDAARRHFESLLVDPRMEVVTFRVGAEAQLAQLIAYAIPRSDCIVDRAVHFFDWRMEEGRVDQSGVVAFILNRERGLRFRNAVERPDHPHHVAWKELTTPLSTKRRFWKYVPDTGIEHLLAAIRTEQPLLESDLNPECVAKWDERLSLRAPSRPSAGATQMPLAAKIWIGVLAAMGVLSVLGHLPDPQDQYNTANYESTPAPPSDMVGGQSTPVEDIGPVLAEIGGRELTLTDLHLSNPMLADELETRWAAARDQKTGITDFQRSIEKLLLDRIALAFTTMQDVDLVVAHQRMRLDDLKKLAGRPADCVALGQPGKLAIGDVPSDFSADQKGLYAKVLSGGYRTAQFRPDVDASTENAAATAVAKKIGTTPDQARRILAGKAGSASDQCIARIAEIEMLLDLPDGRGGPLLRFL